MASQTETTEETQALGDIVTAAMEEHRMPGVALGVLHDGEEHIAGFGVGSVLTQVPVDGETLFQIGSTTKTMTALIAVRLVEEGKLDLDVPVRTYLPDFRMADPEVTERLTMRHLLQHTGGFDGDYFADFGRGDDDVNVARPWPVPRVANPAGGLASSARDNLRYARFLLGDGTTEDGTRLISCESMAMLQTPTFPAGPGTKVGLAWYTREVGGVRIVSHGGGTNGQLSAFLFAPEQQFALVILTNGNKGEVMEAITKWAYERYLGVSESKPEPRPATEAELGEYPGAYDSIAIDVEIVRQDGGMILTMAYKPDVFAKISDQAPPEVPPMALAMVAEDRGLVTDGPLKDSEIEFVRDQEGRVL